MSAQVKQRFGYVVITGRHKILDYDKPNGQQIATAGDEDAAQLIRHRLNAHDALVEAVRELLNRFYPHTCDRGSVCAKCGALLAARGVLDLAEKEV